MEGRFNGLKLFFGCEGRQRKHADHAQGEAPVNRKNHEERKAEQQYVLIDLINDGSHKMPNRVHIAGLTGHQIAGAVPVIEAEVLSEQPSVYVVAHVKQQLLGSGLKNIQIQIPQDGTEQRGQNQQNNKPVDQMIGSAFNDIIHNNTGDVWIHDSEQGTAGYQEQSERHSFLVLFQK